MIESKLSYIKIGSKIIVESTLAVAKDKLDAGTYKLLHDPYKDMLVFEVIDFKNDKILPLPSDEYEKVVNKMGLFMSEGAKLKFKKLEYLYKRGVLLYGEPGTGKTIITTRITQKAVEEYNAICLFVENVRAIKKAYEFLNKSQPDQLLVVVFEEFDRLADEDEEDLLLLLDGQTQRDNVIFLATTNYIDRIPKRLRRPGRMSTVIEVGYPSFKVRESYLAQKLGKNFELLAEWSEKTEGLTIDELKEVVQSVYILEEDIDETVERLIETRTFDEKNKEGLLSTSRKYAKLAKKFSREE